MLKHIFVIGTLRSGQQEFSSQKGYLAGAMVNGVSPKSSQKGKQFSVSSHRFTIF
jgi:hypothetical protein